MSKAPKEVLSSGIFYHPGREAVPIMLGAVVEFVTQHIWAVGLAMRHAVDPALLAGLDQLSRELIEGRVEIIKGEIDDALSYARQPGDVLHILSSRNGWSFNVARPSAFTPPENKTASNLTFETLAERFIVMAYTHQITPVIVDAPMHLAKAMHHSLQHDKRHHEKHVALAPRPGLPPPWMLPPVVWRVPISG